MIWTQRSSNVLHGYHLIGMVFRGPPTLRKFGFHTVVPSRIDGKASHRKPCSFFGCMGWASASNNWWNASWWSNNSWWESSRWTWTDDFCGFRTQVVATIMCATGCVHTLCCRTHFFSAWRTDITHTHGSRTECHEKVCCTVHVVSLRLAFFTLMLHHLCCILKVAFLFLHLCRALPASKSLGMRTPTRAARSLSIWQIQRTPQKRRFAETILVIIHLADVLSVSILNERIIPVLWVLVLCLLYSRHVRFTQKEQSNNHKVSS